MAMEFKGSHFERDVILWGVRWYVAYPLSYRQIEEMMGERGVEVGHTTLHRWVLKYVPLLEGAFLARKCAVSGSWLHYSINLHLLKHLRLRFSTSHAVLTGIFSLQVWSGTTSTTYCAVSF